MSNNVGDGPLASLERTFVEDFLRARGHDRDSLERLPAAARERLLAEAEEAASLQLAQIEARRHLLNDLDIHKPR